MSLGARARARREELGLTQEQLAKLVGVSQSAVWLLEADRTAKPRFIVEYAEALKTSTEYLLQGKKSEVPGRLDLNNGIVAEIISAEGYKETGRPAIDLLIVGQKDEEAPSLFRFGVIGDQIIVTPTDHKDNRTAALPYYPQQDWHIGEVGSGEQKHSFCIVGVVQALTIPSNLL